MDTFSVKSRTIVDCRRRKQFQVGLVWVFVHFLKLFWLPTRIHILHLLKFLRKEITFTFDLPFSEPEPEEIPKKNHENDEAAQENDADNDNSSELEQPQQNSQDNVQGAEALPQETEKVDKSEKSDTVDITLVSTYPNFTYKCE